jgi:sister chromatid cohesion protein PDS5
MVLCLFFQVEAPKHKMLIEETDEFGNEVPLGKIVKLLKSQREKKMGRKQKTPSGSVNAGNDDDVLDLLREINMDNQENTGGSEKNKPKKHWPNEKESNEKPVDFSTPKRKRSISNNRPQSTKGSKNSGELLLHTPNTDGAKKSVESKLEKEKSRNESTGTDQLVVSPSSSKTPVSKGNKGVKKTLDDIVNSSPEVISSISMVCNFKIYILFFNFGFVLIYCSPFSRSLLIQTVERLQNQEV